jgi:transcriptional regulator with XRE-family HTH domain
LDETDREQVGPAADQSTRKADPIDILVGSRVRSRRVMLGMTQQKLGEYLEITFQQVQKYEKGINRVSASTLYRLGEVLSVPVQYFFSGAETPESTDDEPLKLLQDRQTAAVLRAFSQITDKQRRQAVFEFVCGLAPNEPGAERSEDG